MLPCLQSIDHFLSSSSDLYTDKSVNQSYPKLPNTLYSHTVQCAWRQTSHPYVTRMGRAGNCLPSPVIATYHDTTGHQPFCDTTKTLSQSVCVSSAHRVYYTSLQEVLASRLRQGSVVTASLAFPVSAVRHYLSGLPVPDVCAA